MTIISIKYAGQKRTFLLCSKRTLSLCTNSIGVQVDFGQGLSYIPRYMALTHEDGISTPREATHPNRPLEVFHQKLVSVIAGKNKRVDLVTIQNDLNGQQSTMSQLVKQLNGSDPISFSDQQIHDDLLVFFQELSGEKEPLQILWNMRREGEGLRDSSHTHHDILTIQLDAAYVDNVQFGVSVVTDESKDWSWTYFIAPTPKPKFTLSQLFKRSVHDQTSSRM